MTWEETEIALQDIASLVKQLCEIKPSAKAPKEEQLAWEEQMKPIRDEAVRLHYERISILQRNRYERKT